MMAIADGDILLQILTFELALFHSIGMPLLDAAQLVKYTQHGALYFAYGARASRSSIIRGARREPPCARCNFYLIIYNHWADAENCFLHDSELIPVCDAARFVPLLSSLSRGWSRCSANDCYYKIPQPTACSPEQFIIFSASRNGFRCMIEID